MISKCCICNNKEIKTVLNIPFKDILGKPSSDTWNPSVAICDKCGFIFQQNPFTEKELDTRYKNNSKFEFDSSDYIPSGDDDYSKRCLRQKNFIEENCEEFDSILEIGAASGYNLSLWKENKTVLGIEPSANNCKLAKKFYKVDMYNGMFSEYINNKVSKKKFDMIYASMVLEHIVNPFAFVKQCSEICNKYFFIEVPTLDYKFIDEPYGMICEEHVNIFTLEGLSSLMNSIGYSLVNAEICYEMGTRLPAGYPSLQTIWEKNLNLDIKKKIYTNDSLQILSTYIRVNKKELQNINKKISSIPNTQKIAVWGAGHHLSMLLANTCLQEKNIVRVYDSDQRKEGMLMGGTSIRPYNKRDIDNGEVESILITTYVAQKQIMNFLKKEKLDIPVYTLY